MERESFENELIAGLLNEHFVPVKVDREERPDVDRIYMSSLQALGQDGGWPMSMFLTPELKPFWGGTYFPPEARYGRSGFPEILRRIHEIWSTDRSQALEAAKSLADYLNDLSKTKASDREPSEEILELAFQQLAKTFDGPAGGFGRGPKFPRPVNLEFLLRYHYRTGSERAREMLDGTLSSMMNGGMYDQIGGGFHRYAVDREWRVPHFEKMLYDQAQLLSVYCLAFRLSGNPEYRRIIRETAGYVVGEMTSSEGGFYSAEDADSPRPEKPDESGEGAFYVWTRAEIDSVLGADAPLFSEAYGIQEEGNAPVDPQHEFTGRNIPYVSSTPKSLAVKYHLGQEELAAILSRSRGRLRETRQSRPRPHRDDKILASWNGLMISGLSDAYAALQDPAYMQAAERAAEFLLRNLRDEATGKLMRRFRQGESRHEGFLDDYAFVVQGLIDLYEVTGRWTWLREAITLTERQIELFWDANEGGFFETTGKDRSILVRLKEHYDGAEPTGNSVSAMNLVRLGRAAGREEWVTMASEIFRVFASILQQQPVALPKMLSGVGLFLAEPSQVVLAGNPDDPALQALAHQVFSRYLPHMQVLYADGGEGQSFLSKQEPAMKGMSPIDGKPAAYVCRNFVCTMPTSDPLRLGDLLGNP
jgi:uncharacterized protein YyaL (SSP411 family)